MLIYSQYDCMTEKLYKALRDLICGMMSIKEEEEIRQECIERNDTLKMMAANAAKMMVTSKETDGPEETRHWANRERLCRDLIELINPQSSLTLQDGNRGERSKLGQSNALLYGGGHGPPWKGRAPPLVLQARLGPGDPDKLL
jgi:hypothetical protein